MAHRPPSTIFIALLSIHVTNGQCVSTTTALTDVQINTMLADLREALIAPRRGQVPGDAVGGIVRLAFHDSAGFDQHADDGLGVDGCVDFSNPDNNGLQDTVALLADLRAPYCQLISRSDFWVLAAKAAVELAADCDYTVGFRYGRTDNAECAVATQYAAGSRLPSAEGDQAEIERVFVTQMGLTFDDAVALLGAHTLGRAQRGNSGYEGPWTHEPGHLNNEYFHTLTEDPWRRRRATVNGVTKTTWRDDCDRIMLNVDMEIAFDTAGENNCGGNRRCGNKDLAAHFAENNQAWLDAFAGAFQDMTEVGYNSSYGNALTNAEFVPTAATTGACVAAEGRCEPPLRPEEVAAIAGGAVVVVIVVVIVAVLLVRWRRRNRNDNRVYPICFPKKSHHSTKVLQAQPSIPTQLSAPAVHVPQAPADGGLRSGALINTAYLLRYDVAGAQRLDNESNHPLTNEGGC